MGVRMGRPPKGMKEYKVQLDPAAVEETDSRVGTYRRSAFIRDAMREKLDRDGKPGSLDEKRPS